MYRLFFADLGTALIEAREQGKDPFEALEMIMSWEDFVNFIDEVKRLSRPMNYDYLDLLKYRFNYLHKYTPTLLEAFEFTSTKSGKFIVPYYSIARFFNLDIIFTFCCYTASKIN